MGKRKLDPNCRRDGSQQQLHRPTEKIQSAETLSIQMLCLPAAGIQKTSERCPRIWTDAGDDPNGTRNSTKRK